MPKDISDIIQRLQSWAMKGLFGRLVKSRGQNGRWDTGRQPAPPSPTEQSDEVTNSAHWLPFVALSTALQSWAHFERNVDVTVWIVLGTSAKRGACVTNQIQSVRAKIMLIEDLLLTRSVPAVTLRQLRKFRNDIEGIKRERNRLAHDPHFFEDGKLFASRAQISPDGNRTIKEGISDEYLAKFSNECVRQSAFFDEIMKSLQHYLE